MEGVELLEGEVFKQIIGFENYYISNCGRCYNVKNKRFIGAASGNGYINVRLVNDEGKQNFSIHRLVMTYFGPPQPEGMMEIDHISHDKADNRIQNLRWCNRVQNNRNRASYKNSQFEFYEEIPADEEDIIEIIDYGNHQFEDLYFVNDYFYLDTGLNYKQLTIKRKRHAAYVDVYDTEGKLVHIFYTQFKKLCGLN